MLRRVDFSPHYAGERSSPAVAKIPIGIYSKQLYSDWNAICARSKVARDSEGILRVKTAALVLNFFLPGVGSLVIGKVGQGTTQLILYVLGILFTFTLIGAIIGIPFMLAAWIWGMVTAASSEPTPVQVTVIHQQAPLPNPPVSQGATTDVAS